MNKKRVFSGVRATSRLHIGNYLGAVKGMLELQGSHDCIFSVVDLHTIMSPFDPKTLQDDIRAIVLDYLGGGLDPKKCHLMVQSQVPEHVELAFLFSTIYPVSRLEQLPTYKEKKKEQPDYINMGLLYYPILMAADILIYKAELVPVGKDQLPHIELSREVARKFNQMFPSTSPSATSSGPSGSGQVIFPEPQAYETSGNYVPSLTGSGKMSKSIEGSFILLTDDLATIKERLAKVPTDLGKGEKVPQEGGVATLFQLVALFQGEERRKKCEEEYLTTGLQYQKLKEELAEAIHKELKPIQERRKYFEEHPEEVRRILEEGRKYCAAIAKQTLKEAKTVMGLL